MDKIFIKNVIRELLKAVRGKHSQEALNKKFGFSFNQFYKWEKGTTKISWPEFVKMCHLCQAPLRLSMAAILPSHVDITSGQKIDRLESSHLMKLLIGNMTIDKFSKKYNFPRGSISKWLAGQAHPTLEQVFFILHYHSGLLIKLLDSIVGPKNLPCLREVMLKRKIREVITYKYPEVPLILDTMHTKGFKAKSHIPEGYFANKFGLTISEEKEILQALLESEAIQAFHSTYRINESDLFKISPNAEQVSKRYIRYLELLSKSLERGEVTAPQNFFYHIVFPSHLQQIQNMKKILRKACEDLAREVSDALAAPVSDESEHEKFDKVMIGTLILCQVD